MSDKSVSRKAQKTPGKRRRGRRLVLFILVASITIIGIFGLRYIGDTKETNKKAEDFRILEGQLNEALGKLNLESRTDLKYCFVVQQKYTNGPLSCAIDVTFETKSNVDKGDVFNSFSQMDRYELKHDQDRLYATIGTNSISCFLSERPADYTISCDGTVPRAVYQMR